MSYRLSWGYPRSRPMATYALIVINTAVYLVSSFSNMFAQVSEDWVSKFSYVPALMLSPEQWYRIITCMFLHGDIFHIFFNMLFLFWFGRELELLLGIGRYLMLYLVSGIAASIFHTGFIPIIGVLSLAIPAIGASGAISGLLGAYLLTYPRRRLSICWFYLFIPLCFTTTAAFFLMFWFATQIIYGYLRFGGIAFFAHVGGFVAGLSLIYLLKRKRQDVWTYKMLLPFDYNIKPLGLGRTTKLILSLLLLVVLGGGVYSAITAYQASSVYVVDLTVCTSTTDNCHSDEGVYTPLREENITPSNDDARVVFNRFIWSGVMHEYEYCNTSKIINFRGNIIRAGYKVYVYINGHGRYDEYCILTEFKGVVATQILHVDPFGTIRGVSREVYWYNVTLQAQNIAGNIGEAVIRPHALISSILTLSSIFVVVLKDYDVIEEFALYPPAYAPWI